MYQRVRILWERFIEAYECLSLIDLGNETVMFIALTKAKQPTSKLVARRVSRNLGLDAPDPLYRSILYTQHHEEVWLNFCLLRTTLRRPEIIMSLRSCDSPS